MYQDMADIRLGLVCS